MNLEITDGGPAGKYINIELMLISTSFSAAFAITTVWNYED